MLFDLIFYYKWRFIIYGYCNLGISIDLGNKVNVKVFVDEQILFLVEKLVKEEVIWRRLRFNRNYFIRLVGKTIMNVNRNCLRVWETWGFFWKDFVVGVQSFLVLIIWKK